MQPAPRSTHTQAPASSPPVTPAMRTLALLAALLLLALQAQAEPLPENHEEAPDHRDNEEDQDMAISFAGPEAPGLQREQIRHFQDPIHGICTKGNKLYIFCCL
nr:alpha-defensin 24-like [Marmota flaviventris]